MRSGARRTYVVSLYDGDGSVVVEAVQRDERARVESLDGLARRIQEWEDADRASPPGEPEENDTSPERDIDGGGDDQ